MSESYAAMDPEEISERFSRVRAEATLAKQAQADLAQQRTASRELNTYRPESLRLGLTSRGPIRDQLSPEAIQAQEASDLDYFNRALDVFESNLERARRESWFDPNLAINQLVFHLSRLRGETRSKAVHDADLRYADTLFHEFWQQVKIGKGEDQQSIYKTAKLKQNARLNSPSIPSPQRQNPGGDHEQGADHTVAAQLREARGIQASGVMESVSTAEMLAEPLADLSKAIIDAFT